MDQSQASRQEKQQPNVDTPAIVRDRANSTLTKFKNSSLPIYKCTDIETMDGLADHVFAQRFDQPLFDKWLWHGGYQDSSWIEHTSNCRHSTDQLMRSLETMSELIGLPKHWWTILQPDSDSMASIDPSNKPKFTKKSGFRNQDRHRRDTMYQGDDKILDALFVTDVGDATLHLAALGFVSMPKIRLEAYACSWSVFLLCEIGSDYDDIPMCNLQHAWATSLETLSLHLSDSQWTREVYVPTLLGIVLRKAMGRRPYFNASASRDPMAWCAARVLHGGSYLAVGVELHRFGVDLDDKSRFLQAVALILAHDLFEERSDRTSGDTPNITPALRKLMGCDGQTAYSALLHSDLLHHSVKRCCIGWTLATLTGQRWANSLQMYDFHSVRVQELGLQSTFGAQPLGAARSTWRRCSCGEKKTFPQTCTMHDLSCAARKIYLESSANDECVCWCAHDRAYDIVTASFRSSLPTALTT